MENIGKFIFLLTASALSNDHLSIDEALHVLLAVAGFAVLFMGILGNTRPIGASIVAVIIYVVMAGLLKGSGRHMGLAVFTILPASFFLCIVVPVSGFIIYMAITVAKKTYTIKLSTVARIASICAGGILFAGMLFLSNCKEETAIRNSFPPAYQELCTPAEKKHIYDESPEQGWALYQNLRALLREKPLVPKDEHNDAVLILLRRIMGGIAKEKDTKRLQEWRLELLQDAEISWQTGDVYNKDKVVAAIITGNAFARPKLGDDSIRERVLALKKDIVRTELLQHAHDDYWEQLLSILAWEPNDAARKRSFDQFLDRDRPQRYYWYEAEQAVYLFDGQEGRDDVIRILSSLIPDLPADTRGLYYGLYAKTHNDRWLALADPKVLFEHSFANQGHESFFFSEVLMLRGEFEDALKERAKYIFSEGFDKFIGGDVPSIYGGLVKSKFLHRYTPRPCPPGRPRNSDGKTYDYTEDKAFLESVQDYTPCGINNSTSCRVDDIYPEKIITYNRFSSCENWDDAKPFHSDSKYKINDIFADFERMARSECFPEKPSPPVTDGQRDCVFRVIKKMNVRTEPAQTQ